MSSPTGSPGSSPTQSYASFWQNKLHDHCRSTRMAPPTWNVVSDRRGGRTAWSCYIIIGGHKLDARYWYDGQYVNNAKEDAAEVALQYLRVIASPTLPLQIQTYPQPLCKPN